MVCSARYKRQILAGKMIAQNGRCYYCERPMVLDMANRNAPNAVTLDHIIPISKGGPHSAVHNGVAACWSCNNERGSEDARLFLFKKQGLIDA